MMEEDARPLMRSVALSVTGEFLLLIGAVFLLWGISDFVTGFLGVKGAGQSLVGLFLIVLAFALLLRSKAMIPRPHPQKEEKRSGDYR